MKAGYETSKAAVFQVSRPVYVQNRSVTNNCAESRQVAEKTVAETFADFEQLLVGLPILFLL
jgi:hypothetical protein